LDGRGQHTRERILAATVEVIAREGWRGVTVRKIAAAADVNAALVNYHFGSKTNLMLAALESALEEQVVSPMLDAFADGEPERVLFDLVQITLAPREHGDAQRVFESALAAVVHDPELASRLRPTLRRFRGVLAEVFDRAIASGKMPPSDTEALAIVCTALLDGLWLHHLIDPDLPAERIANTAAELLPKA
jgi:AcrR family transcriptional regulator